MPPALVASTAVLTTNNNTATTAAITTTGATLLVAVIADQAGVATTLTDSKTNSWTGLTTITGGNAEVRLYYAANPTVGTGHTFTATSTGAFPALAVLAFSGVALTSPFDVQSGAFDNNGSALTLAMGSITPGVANEVLVGGLCMGKAGVNIASVSTNFTLLDNFTATATAYGVASAYELQTTATARNLTWTTTVGGTNMAGAVASFKEPVGPATKAPPPRRPQWRLIRRAA
jgi:hypothetical protein